MTRNQLWALLTVGSNPTLSASNKKASQQMEAFFTTQIIFGAVKLVAKKTTSVRKKYENMLPFKLARSIKKTEE